MINGKDFIFTSESVCSGHPDKICDLISDSILDEAIRRDKYSKVAVEVLATENRLIIAGEVTTSGNIDYKKIARGTIKKLGYTNPIFRFTQDSQIDVLIHEQSRDISRGVDKKGAGDQGMMFGFACVDTKSLMPLPISIAHSLTSKIDEVRDDGIIPFLRPDGKAQVSVEYKSGKPYKLKNIVIAVCHDENISLKELREDVVEKIIAPVVNKYNMNIPRNLVVNGAGKWNIPGPASDTGLTGRKIIVDSYGGFSRVGGGAFSGKDPTKVDRSGAYAARFIAKNIVANNLAKKAEVRLAYSIGVRKPLMQQIEMFGTSKVKGSVIKDFVNDLIDTSVEGIIEGLDLRRPIFSATTNYGHFGKKGSSWEKIVR